MFTNARLTKSATALAVLFVVVGGYLPFTHTAMAQAPDVDEMTGRNIRYVTADAMYLANEQWLLYAYDLPAGQTAMVITKMFTLKTTLAYDPVSGKLGDVGNPATYDPMKGLRYYPHKIRATFMTKPGMPPAPIAWEVVDKTSHLRDQASLLWGTSEFYFYSDPTVKDVYDAVFGDQGDHKTHGALFPAKPHMLSKGLSVVTFKNMMAMHFDKTNGSFRSVALPRGTQAKRIVVVNVPTARIRAGKETRGVVKRGQALLLEQARDDWVLVRYRSEEGKSVQGWIKPSQIADITTADAGLALIALKNLHSGLLAAYAVTGQDSFKAAADKAYGFMNRDLWSETAATYRSAEGAMESVYTPRNVAATIGALRELALATNGAERKLIVGRIDKFFAAAHTRHGIQLAEIDPTGEPIPSMAQIKAMKAQLAALMKTDPQRAKAMMMKMADVDGDGVPKPGMAGGKFGFAPVPALAVKLATE